MYGPRLRFGAFIAPFHALDENPTLALERDLELTQWLERLGYDEVWFGEHHSCGYELISSPELFIASAAERTRRIRLGAGVISLPYHNPLMVAQRINQLDHITRGRVMFGFGPGALPLDARMQGIELAKQRDMMDEALGVIVRLLRGEVVTHKTSWFALEQARLHLASYSQPSVELAVASQISPTGARAAGRHGLGMLSLGATSTGGFNALASNWAIAEELARDHGTTVDRTQWRLVGPMHIAETRAQARENVRFGLEKWLYYFREIAVLPLAPAGGDPVDELIASGLAVIGTPEDAVAQLQRLQGQTGGYGCFLHLAVNWADWEETKRSYELFARYVVPRLHRSNDSRVASVELAQRSRGALMQENKQALDARIQRHIAERGASNISPDLLVQPHGAQVRRAPE